MATLTYSVSPKYSLKSFRIPSQALIVILSILSAGVSTGNGFTTTATLFGLETLGIRYTNLPPVCPSSVPYDEPECFHHTDCPTSRSCFIDLKCRDTCIESDHRLSCGSNAVCRVINHQPTCECQPGYEGDPSKGCVSKYSRPAQIVRPETAAPGVRRRECTTHSDCADHLNCFADFVCRDVCTASLHGLMCGPNSKCEVVKHNWQCSKPTAGL